LGWSHGNEEIFATAQFVEWFDLEHISRSAAQFNPEKLAWINAQYLKAADNARLAALVKRFLQADGCDPDHGPALDQGVGLLKERVNTLEELADAAVYFFRALTPTDELRAQHYLTESRPALEALLSRLQNISWSKADISAALKSVTEAHKLKMPKVAMPL